MNSTAAVHASKAGEGLRESVVIPVWSLTIMLVVMNTTMFNVALPNVAKEFALSSTTSAWIITGYSIIFAIATITYSRLSDFIPIRRLLTIGLTMLGIASVIGFLAHNFMLLLFARVLQAAGAAAVPGLGMVLITRYIPVSRRGKAMSMISSAASLGFGLGPVIGGAITQYFGWNFLFAVTGVVFMVIPLFQKLLPQENAQKVYFDILGGILTGIGITALLLFFTSYSVLLLIIGLGAIFFLNKRIHQHENPFIQPALLRNRRYLLLNSIGFSAFIVHFSALFLIPIMLVRLFDKSSAEIGLIIFPGAILSAFAAQFIGKIIDQFGNKVLILTGHLFLLAAALLFAFVSTASSTAILFVYIIMSLGFTSLTSSVSNEISRILAKNEVGTGMGLAQLVQFIGGAFGVAITGVSLHWQQHIPAAQMFQHIFFGMAAVMFFSFIMFQWYKRMKQS